MIELFNDFVGFISDYLIRGIFFSVLVVWIAELVFKKLDTQNVKTTLRWSMIGYSCLALMNVLIILMDEFYHGVEYSGYSFSGRAFGNYWVSFWLMLAGNMILPFILLFKRIGNKLIFLFLVAMMMNIGWLFELFVIVVTSFHRDYIP